MAAGISEPFSNRVDCHSSDVAAAIEELTDTLDKVLGPELDKQSILEIVEGGEGHAFQIIITERALRAIRFALLETLDTI